MSILIKLTIWLPVLNHFANGNWRIYVNETTKVWDRMNKRDNELFYNDLRTLKWDIFCFSYWAGLRVYILKDPITTVDQARKRFTLFELTFKMICVMMAVLFTYYYSEYFLLLLVPFFNAVKLLNTLI